MDELTELEQQLETVLAQLRECNGDDCDALELELSLLLERHQALLDARDDQDAFRGAFPPSGGACTVTRR